MSSLIQAFREWQAARAYRDGQRFFDNMAASARRWHAPTKYIERARQSWLHRALEGRRA